MLSVDGDLLMKVAPGFSGKKAEAQAAIVGAIGPVLGGTLKGFEIDTRLRIAHFVAQLAHESAGFRTTEEFATGAACEGRTDLGNIRSGDGRRYKGRGLIQLTGRANYRIFGAALGLPLEDEPALAAEPVVSLEIACAYWRQRKINAPSDRDDLVAVTRLVNGGTNGLAERAAYLAKAKAALAERDAIVVAAHEGGASVVLRRGSRNDSVGRLQALLRTRGFGLAVDNDFGAATELAVECFQKSARIDVDGVVGRMTWTALGA